MAGGVTGTVAGAAAGSLAGTVDAAGAGGRTGAATAGAAGMAGGTITGGLLVFELIAGTFSSGFFGTSSVASFFF